MKINLCSKENCENPRFSKKLCLFHYKKENPKKFQIQKKQNKTIGSLKNNGIIKKVSEKQKKRLEKYYLLRDEYLKNHPVCEFEGCNSKEVTLHHKKGRIGENLFNHFCALCFTHHRWVEDNPEQAKLLNLSKNRL